MGQKVHPTGFRLGVYKGWQSRWYAERDYKDILAEDFEIRKIINKELANASVSRIEIERTAADQVQVKIHTAKPGIVIGRSGEKVERLKSLLEARTKKRRVRVEIIEIRQPELDAYLVGRNIAEQLERRVSFRRAMKQAVQKTMRANAKGIKVIVGGRLGGAEIARSEKEVEGSVPLHTLRADIDYGQTEAHTTFGVIGVKVWIYRGDVLPEKQRKGLEAAMPVAQPVAPREERRGERHRGERGARPSRRGGGERAARPQGERGTRPQGERAARPQGERSARPQGERSTRSQSRTPRAERSERPARPPRSTPQEQASDSTTSATSEQNTPPAPPATDAETTQSE